MGGSHNTSPSRRQFLKTAAVTGAAAWLPAFRIDRADAAASCGEPPNFPQGIDLYQQAFKNWSTEIQIDDLWTCAPKTPEECVELANWAAANGWHLRPRGVMHTWAPIHVTKDTDCNDNIVMVSTTEHLTKISDVEKVGDYGTVSVQSGLLMDDLLEHLEKQGYGMNNVPAPGDVTIGGVLAIDAHGTAIPTKTTDLFGNVTFEATEPGHSFGTLSNLVLSITAVAWNGNQYELQTYDRSHPHCKALLTNLGRTMITEVVFQVGELQHLRCESIINVSYREIMGPKGSSPRTFEKYLDKSGRAEIIWFPFTENPWLKVWTVEDTKPLTSREVTEPYNYPFSDNIPDELEQLARSLPQDNEASTPFFGQSMYGVTTAGLLATNSTDIWGPAKNTQLYIKPTTIRITASGYGVVTRREHIQDVLHKFTEYYIELRDEYAARGEYPMNMPVEVRVNGLDVPNEVKADGAEFPALSAASPDPARSDWDVVIWFNCLSFPFTKKADEFYARMEAWMHSASPFGEDVEALVRPEWSKGWGYTADAPWTSDNYVSGTIPEGYRQNRSSSENWDWTIRRLDQLDPNRVFTNEFLDKLLR